MAPTCVATVALPTKVCTQRMSTVRAVSNLGASSFLRGNTVLSSRCATDSRTGHRRPFVVQNAASKLKMKRDLDVLTALLNREETMLVAGIRYQGLTVNEMIKFRRELPEGSHLVVAKNTLMVKASEETKFAPIAECAVGMNAWLFVDENVAPCVKGIKKLTKEWQKEGLDVDFSGAVLDGKYIEPKDMGPLEKLPTKKDLIAKVAVCIKQVPTKMARGTKGVPLKLAYGIKAVADGDSDLINA